MLQIKKLGVRVGSRVQLITMAISRNTLFLNYPLRRKRQQGVLTFRSRTTRRRWLVANPFYPASTACMLTH